MTRRFFPVERELFLLRRSLRRPVGWFGWFKLCLFRFDAACYAVRERVRPSKLLKRRENDALPHWQFLSAPAERMECGLSCFG